MANINESKLISFQLAPQKKSRFQKAKEEEQLKKNQEEEEASRALEAFTSSFIDSNSNSNKGGNSGRKVFVKSGEVVSQQPSNNDVNKLRMDVKVGRDSMGCFI
jgi:hypothetical protein